MSDIFYILEKAGEIQKFCGMADVWEICDKLEIIAQKKDLGSASSGLKGFCTSFFHQYFLAVNRRLPRYLQECVALHELGHIILHADALQNGGCLHEYQPFRTASVQEREANYFAAELKIRDEEIRECLTEGYTAVQAAAILKIPHPLLLSKAEIMRKNGCKLQGIVLPDATFWGENLLGKENF